RLRPRFYQTVWFWAGCGLGVALAGLGVHRLRVASLQSSERHLASLVEQRTHELERQKGIAEQADRMKTELLEIASHDLKNPLQVVTTYAEMLTFMRDMPPQVTKMSHHIFRAS